MYFGTDGIRGEAHKFITPQLCFNVGKATARYFGRTCLIGRDTRPSSLELSRAFAEGASFCGVKVYDGGVIPTPAVSTLTKKHGFNFGVVISASHNPHNYNGIKLFGYGGTKLSQSQEEEIELLISKIEGKNKPYQPLEQKYKSQPINAKKEYTDFLIDYGKGLGVDFSKMEVVLDSGFGAVGTIAHDVFSALNAQPIALNHQPIGKNINLNCGAVHPEFVLANAKNGLGFAFDGDGDRVACVEGGQILDGDSALYSLSRISPLKDGVVVGTIMANSALSERLSQNKKLLVRVDVGDKNIASLMQKNDYNLGGEQSGHYIFSPVCSSGDGILSALMLAKAYKLGAINRLNLAYQRTIHLPIESFDEVQRLIKSLAPTLKRHVLRKSGTEPLIRIMLEGDQPNVDSAISLLLRTTQRPT